jgi:hypothetical protein
MPGIARLVALARGMLRSSGVAPCSHSRA